LGVDAADVEVTCIYRKADKTMLDILTFEKSCGDGRRLSGKGRALKESGLGIQVEMKGEAQEAVADLIEESGDGGVAAISEKLQAAPVVVKSDLIEGGSLEAEVAEIEKPEIVTVEVYEIDTTTSTPKPPPPTGTIESAAFSIFSISLFCVFA
jgi:hypothetical protein